MEGEEVAVQVQATVKGHTRLTAATRKMVKKIPSDATSVATLLVSPPNRSSATPTDSLSAPVPEWTMVEKMVMRLRRPRVGTHTPTRPGQGQAGVGPTTARGVEAAAPRVAPCCKYRRHMAACIPRRARRCNKLRHAGNSQNQTTDGAPREATLAR